ncbi:MAG: hypothetical protein AAF067_11645, partial [Pseudomonadota bacterium]
PAGRRVFFCLHNIMAGSNKAIRNPAVRPGRGEAGIPARIFPILLGSSDNPCFFVVQNGFSMLLLDPYQMAGNLKE